MFFLVNWRLGPEVYVQIDRFKLLPTDFVDGSLRLYHYQRFKYSNAFFIPKIYNHHLIFRLRLHQLINKDDIKLHTIQNITFQCYLISQNMLYRANDSLLTVHVSTSLFPEVTTVIRFYKNSTKCARTLRIIGALKRRLVVYVPLLVKYKAVYKFSYRTETKNETFLKWPIWPLPSECIHHYQIEIKKKNKRLSLLPASCLTNKLQVLTSQQMYMIEKEALSMWLDIQYSVSNVSSVFPYRRLAPFERVSNGAVCSLEFQSWISKYQAWHSKIGRRIRELNLNNAKDRDVILKHNIRFILFENFGSGTADRITHLISTYMIAILTNRFFLFDDSWPEFHKVMRSSLDYQAEIITPWIFRLNEVNANISQEDPRFFSVKSQIIREERPHREYDYDHEYPERVLLVKSHTGNVVHTLTSSRSVYSEFLSRKLHMRADNLFGCLYHSLIIPRLSMFFDMSSTPNDSFQYMLQMLMSPKFPTIGIQIRVGDSYMKKSSQNLFNYDQSVEKYKSYFECAQHLSDGQTLPLVYLMCDSLNLRRAALFKWPFPANISQKMQVISSLQPPRHISYTSDTLSALRTAMFETFLFSLCEVHIITTASGFGRFPAFASLQGRPIYSFSAEDQPVCSKGEGKVTLTEAGHQWSGMR
jgi:hypothetical protein